MASKAATKRLASFKAMLTAAHERLAPDFGFVLWDGSTVPENLSRDSLSILIADEGDVANAYA